MKRGMVVSMAAVAFAAALPASAKVCDARQYGAKPDGVTKNTQAIQRAIDACSAAGGGTVKLEGGKFLSGPVVLRSQVTLEIAEGSTLFGSPDHADYPKITEFRAPGTQSLVSAKNAEDIAITGKGTIDGNGQSWWDEARKTPNAGFVGPDTNFRPRLVVFDHCKRVKMEGVTVKDSPSWQIVPYYSDHVEIRNVKILAPQHSPNTDAIDPFSSSNMVIDHVVADVGDDNIAIKAGKKIDGREFACENITITDCVFKHGHGLSIGSETAGGVRGVTVKNCRFENTENGIRIKSRRDRGGRVEDISYTDLVMTNVHPAMSFACYYQDSSQLKLLNDDKAQPVTETTPAFKNIRVKNLTAHSSRAAGVIVGLPESFVTNFVLEDVRITAQTGLTIANAAGVELKNVTILVQKGDPYTLHNAEIKGLPGKQPAPAR